MRVGEDCGEAEAAQRRADARQESSGMPKGLLTKSSAPASSACTLSASELRTVSMMMPTLGSARISRHAAKPPIPGMLISSRTISGRNVLSFSSASSPVLASSISYPAPVSAVRMIRRICGSSSTTRILPALTAASPWPSTGNSMRNVVAPGRLATVRSPW